MPPRDPALPEGTDHIIQGAAQLDGGAGGGGGNGGASGGGAASGFVAASTGGDDTGGTAGSSGASGTSLTGTGGGGSGGGTSGGSSGGTAGLGAGAERVRTQVRDQIQSLKGQATDKARQFADDGKGRATDMLDNFSAVINDAARAIDERLGPDYSGYAHRAAGAVSGFAGTLRDKDLEDLLDDTRSAIRRSPGIAIGIAAIAGFALVRILKTGLDDSGLSGGNQSGGGQGGGNQGGSGQGGGSTGGSATGSATARGGSGAGA